MPSGMANHKPHFYPFPEAPERILVGFVNRKAVSGEKVKDISKRVSANVHRWTVADALQKLSKLHCAHSSQSVSRAHVVSQTSAAITTVCSGRISNAAGV